MSLSKKIFIFSSILLGIMLVFLGIYNFVFRANSSRSYKVPVSMENLSSTPAASSKPTEKIYALSKERIVSPVLSSDGNGIMYYSLQGNFTRLDIKSAAERKISEDKIDGLRSIIWAPDGKNAILKANSGGKNSFILYGLENGTKTNLKSGIDYVAWTNLGDKIIYKYFDSASLKRSVNIANPDGSNWKKLADVSWRSVFLSTVPGTFFISFWNAPNAYEETSLETVSLTGEDIKKIFSGRFGADYLWSPDGGKVLISSSDASGGSKTLLAVASKSGGEYQNLEVPTLVSKCVWAEDSQNVYCALPNSIPEGSVMPNDYQDGKFNTKDTFWKINVLNGKKERIVELSDIKSDYDAANLFLSSSAAIRLRLIF